MKKFLSQNTVWTGLVAGLGSEFAFCLLLAAALAIAGVDWQEHARWFGGMFIPLLLVLRTYAKRKEQLTVTRTLIAVLFVTFLAFMLFLIKKNLLTPNH